MNIFNLFSVSIDETDFGHITLGTMYGNNVRPSCSSYCSATETILDVSVTL